MENILTVKSLCKNYKNCRALSDFSMNVPKGSVYGLVGRNGAGKTTLIRILCGLQEPSSGGFTLYGAKSGTKEIYKARRRIGAIIETPAVYTDMTAKENLTAQYKVLGLPSDDGIDELLKFTGLANAGKRKVKNFSLGMRQRLAIAVAMCGEPDFLILDEPMNGLDPQGIIEIRELILKLNRERGVTVLISSHILDELSRIATHYGFADKGTMIREISAKELDSLQRKCLRLKTDNIKAAVIALDKLKAEYRIISDTEADIYGDVNITSLTLSFAAENANILSLETNKASLESYFINLVGGEER